MINSILHHFDWRVLIACFGLLSTTALAQQEAPRLDILSYPQTITAFDVSEDGTMLVVGGDGNLVLGTNLLDGTPLFGIALNHGKSIDEVKISPDKTLAAILSSERFVTIYDLVHQDVLMTADIGGKMFLPPFDILEKTGGMDVTDKMRKKLESVFLPRMTERFRFVNQRLILYSPCFVTEFFLDGKTEESLFNHIQSDFQQAGFVRVKKDTFPNYCHNLPWFARYDSVAQRSYETVVLDPTYRYGFVHYKKGNQWFGEVWDLASNQLHHTFKGGAYLSDAKYRHTTVLSTDGNFLYYVGIDSIASESFKIFCSIKRLDIAAKKDEEWVALGETGLIGNLKLSIDGKYLFGLGAEGDLSGLMGILVSGNLDLSKAKKTMQNALWTIKTNTKSLSKIDMGRIGDNDCGFKYLPSLENAFWGMNKDIFRVNLRDKSSKLAASLVTPKIQHLETTADGFLWAVTDSDIRQFDLLSGQQTQYWPHKGNKAAALDLVHKVAWTSNGQSVFKVDWGENRTTKYASPHKNDLQTLLYHSHSQRLLSGELLGTKSWKDDCRLLNWAPDQTPQNLPFHSTFEFKGMVGSDDTIERRSQPILMPETRIFKAVLSPDGKYLAANVQAKSPIDPWSLFEELGKRIKTGKGLEDGPMDDIVTSKNPYPGEIKLWKYTDREWQEDKALDAHRDGNALERMDMAFSQDGKYLAASNQYLQIKVWNVETGRLAGLCWHQHGDWSTQSQLRHYQEKRKLHEYRTDFSITALVFSPDNRYLVSGGNDQKIVVWKRVPYTDTLRVTRKGDTFSWEHVISSEDSVVYVHDTTVYAINDGAISALTFSPDGRYMFAGGEDGKIFIWDFQRMVPKVAIVLKHNSEGFAALTGKNIYYASPAGLDLLHFKLGNKTYPTEQFDLAYNRPNIMARIFGWMFGDSTNAVRGDSIRNLYDKIVLKRLKTYGVAYDSSLAVKVSTALPTVRILNGQELLKQQVTKATSITLAFEAQAAEAPIGSVQIWVNDVPLFGRKGKSLRTPSRLHTNKVLVPLSLGDNKIEVGCRDTLGNESPKELVAVFSQRNDKPDLYLIALGVDQYRNLNSPLKYAVKDGRDFVKAFSQEAIQSGRFAKVTIDTLFNEQVTVKNVKKLRQKLLKTHVDDHVRVLYSGHGMQDSLQRLFLGTASLDFQNLAGTALPFEVLEDMLDSIPARQKLLFIDACQSGLRDKTEVATSSPKKPGTKGIEEATPNVKSDTTPPNLFFAMQEMFSDLNRGTGTITIAAASGYEEAWEDSKRQNGAFTHVLLKSRQHSPQGYPFADSNQDGEVLVDELQHYLKIEVSRLTNGKQKPTSRSVNLGNNFKVQ